MDPEKSGFQISDVVVSVQGRDKGELYYVVGIQEEFLLLANGKNRTLDTPKR